jgi:small-conductance mechanosensitive channel
MDRLMPAIDELLTHEWLTWILPWMQAAIILVLGWVGGRVGAAIGARVTREHLSAQGVMVVRRLTFWIVFGLAVVSAMRELGFDLSVFLGAAGILTVAIGFASQTSASNLISGLFLLGERPFVVSDVIKVGQYTGEVVSIDLMSVKLRTFDNLLVRVPNETLLKSDIQNLTYFPLRRLDLPLRVPFDSDIERVREILLDVADAFPLALDEPRPAVIFLQFGDHGIELQFSVWAARERWLELKNGLPEKIRQAFDDHGLQFAAPRLIVHPDGPSRPALP